jgi:hypothetical protein
MFPFLIAQRAYAMLILQIYDVTKYLEDHPGGADVLLEVTGTATSLLLMSLVRHFLFFLRLFDHIQ